MLAASRGPCRNTFEARGTNPNRSAIVERVTDAIELLLEKVKADVAAKVLRRLEPVKKVEEALAAYRRAVEGEVATEYARDHSIPSPRLTGDPKATAEALRHAVLALPELACEVGVAESARGGGGPTTAVGASGATGRPAPEASPATSGQDTSRAAPAARDQLPVEWGPLVRAVQHLPLVLVGGVVRRDRLGFVPREVLEKLEWIDTTRQGTHAIGNLAQRMKAGRVGALILMEGLVGHRHSDPLVHASREVGIPFEYAGKGGRAALARAFISINQKAAANEEDV